MIPSFIFYLILVQLLIVSIVDITKKKIFNFWPIMNIIMFPILCYLFQDHYKFEWYSFIFPLAFLLVGFFLFLIRIMGGGDSKYLFSLFLVVPVALHETMLQYLLLSTLVIGSFVLMTNIGTNFNRITSSLKTGEYQEVKQFFGTKFSYAPVILIAWIWLGVSKGFFTL